MEALAEDGDPSGLVSALSQDTLVSEAGGFDTPVGGSSPAPAFPGESYEFTVEAEPGDRLSFATMLVQSNDVLIATPAEGIALLDDMDNPRPTADVEAELAKRLGIWDAGTEANEVPGAGPNQPPRQAAADTGPAEAGGVVRGVDDVWTYPRLADLLRVVETPQ